MVPMCARVISFFLFFFGLPTASILLLIGELGKLMLLMRSPILIVLHAPWYGGTCSNVLLITGCIPVSRIFYIVPPLYFMGVISDNLTLQVIYFVLRVSYSFLV